MRPPPPAPVPADPHSETRLQSGRSPCVASCAVASGVPRLIRWEIGGVLSALLSALLLCLSPAQVSAAPGLCVGPVCGDEFSRSASYHWQLRLRLSDQQGHRERLVVDCRTGSLSPERGLVERGHAAAVARRACRLAGESLG